MGQQRLGCEWETLLWPVYLMLIGQESKTGLESSYLFFFFLEWGDIYVEGRRLPRVGCLCADADNLKIKGPEGALKLPDDASDHQG